MKHMMKVLGIVLCAIFMVIQTMPIQGEEPPKDKLEVLINGIPFTVTNGSKIYFPINGNATYTVSDGWELKKDSENESNYVCEKDPVKFTIVNSNKVEGDVELEPYVHPFSKNHDFESEYDRNLYYIFEDMGLYINGDVASDYYFCEENEKIQNIITICSKREYRDFYYFESLMRQYQWKVKTIFFDDKNQVHTNTIHKTKDFKRADRYPQRDYAVVELEDAMNRSDFEKMYVWFEQMDQDGNVLCQGVLPIPDSKSAKFSNVNLGKMKTKLNGQESEQEVELKKINEYEYECQLPEGMYEKISIPMEFPKNLTGMYPTIKDEEQLNVPSNQPGSFHSFPGESLKYLIQPSKNPKNKNCNSNLPPEKREENPNSMTHRSMRPEEGKGLIIKNFKLEGERQVQIKFKKRDIFGYLNGPIRTARGNQDSKTKEMIIVKPITIRFVPAPTKAPETPKPELKTETAKVEPEKVASKSAAILEVTKKSSYSFEESKPVSKKVSIHYEESQPANQTNYLRLGQKIQPSDLLLLSKEGHDFEGWYYVPKNKNNLDSSIELLPLDKELILVEDIDIYAKWKKQEDVMTEPFSTHKKAVPNTADGL